MASYARRALARAGLAQPWSAPVFNEFAVEVPKLAAVLERCRAQGLHPGVPLGRFFPEHPNRLLVCVTEMNTRAQVDALVRELSA